MTKILNSEQFIGRHKKVNEGAGAAYDVTLDGLKIDKNSIKIIGGDAPFGGTNNMVAFWEANILPCVVDEWKAIGYYGGITSDGDDMYEYVDEDKQVDGGLIRGVVHLEDVEEYMKNDPHDEKVVIDYLKECINDNVGVTYSFGGGWIHINLDDNFKLGYDLDYKNLKDFKYDMLVKKGSYSERLYEIGYAGGEYDGINILYAEINSPNIAHCINLYFEHMDDEYEETNEAYKPVDIVDLDRELEILWQKIYNSIKRILKMNGYGEDKPLILDNPESSLFPQMKTVVLRNGNLFVTFKNNKDRYVFVEDLKDDDFYELYRCVCKTVENLND